MKTSVAYVVDTQSSTETSLGREAHDKLYLLVALRVELEHRPGSLAERTEQVGEEAEEALGWRVRGRVGVAEPLQDGDAVVREDVGQRDELRRLVEAGAAAWWRF